MGDEMGDEMSDTEVNRALCKKSRKQQEQNIRKQARELAYFKHNVLKLVPPLPPLFYAPEGTYDDPPPRQPFSLSTTITKKRGHPNGLGQE